MKTSTWLTIAVAAILSLPIAGYVGGKLETARWQRYAPYVGLTYWDLRRAVDRVRAREQQLSAGEAREVVELLACSSVPTPTLFDSMADAAAAVVARRGTSPRDAVADIITMKTGAIALSRAALENC